MLFNLATVLAFTLFSGSVWAQSACSSVVAANLLATHVESGFKGATSVEQEAKALWEWAEERGMKRLALVADEGELIIDPRECSQKSDSGDFVYPGNWSEAEVVHLGGYFGACFANSQRDLITGFFESSTRKELKIHIPMRGVYTFSSFDDLEKDHELRAIDQTLAGSTDPGIQAIRGFLETSLLGELEERFLELSLYNLFVKFRARNESLGHSQDPEIRALRQNLRQRLIISESRLPPMIANGNVFEQYLRTILSVYLVEFREEEGYDGLNYRFRVFVDGIPLELNEPAEAPRVPRTDRVVELHFYSDTEVLKRKLEAGGAGALTTE